MTVGLYGWSPAINGDVNGDSAPDILVGAASKYNVKPVESKAPPMKVLDRSLGLPCDTPRLTLGFTEWYAFSLLISA